MEEIEKIIKLYIKLEESRIVGKENQPSSDVHKYTKGVLTDLLEEIKNNEQR
jgi:hypothetical protein